MRFGVDEAGKGPVLGSMFAAAVYGEQSDLPDGVGDSKTIAPATRETLAADIRDVTTVGVAEIPVERIDSPETDMNTLTVSAHARALAELIDGISNEVVDEGIGGTLDACDVDATRFETRVAARVPVDVRMTAAHGADESDTLVGAASIIAKVERDAHVERLGDEFGDVGSGYPGDPTTREFLREYVAEHGDLPSCARTSWSTCADVLAAAEQFALDDF